MARGTKSTGVVDCRQNVQLAGPPAAGSAQTRADESARPPQQDVCVLTRTHPEVDHRLEKLLGGGRDRTKFVDGVLGQVEKV